MADTTPFTSNINLDNFFNDVESVKDELNELQKLNDSLQSANEQSKTLHTAHAVKDLRWGMDSDVAQALTKARLIKFRLEALDRSNMANRNIPGCGPGSSTDRSRISVVLGLRKKLKELMESFNSLREKISIEYRETVQRRYFTVTGENPDERTLDRLISTGESEYFLQKAIEEQGKEMILDAVNEIQERHDTVKEMEKNLKQLHTVFLDMEVMVQIQGQELDDIEINMQRGNSSVRGGTQELNTAKILQNNSRKWVCYGIVLLVIIIIVVVLLVVLLVVRPWKNNNRAVVATATSNESLSM